MLKSIAWMGSVGILISGLTAASSADQASRSARVVSQLAAALTAQKLDAIAAKDPNEPDRFVAALFVPGTQLVVISARYASPLLLERKLALKQYRNVYTDLETSAVPQTSIVFEDRKVDGLCASRSQAADTLYDASTTPKIFDNDWDKQHLSEQVYRQQYVSADERYSRLLELLLWHANFDR